MYAQMTQIYPLTLIQRNRLLPVPGEINVRPGQKVHPTEIVAQASIPSRHYLVDVGRVLGAQTNEAAEALITRKVGEMLEKHDIIAETGGLFSRVIRTPGPGRIVSIHKGRVLIEAESEHIEIKAGFSGQVSRVIAERGVSIETYGALVQGVWGNDRIGCGELVVDEAALDSELTPAGLGVTAGGMILMAGGCTSEEMFSLATSLGISGLILGSMPAGLIPVVQVLPYPVILLSGFGKMGLDEVSRQVLENNAGREVSINAMRWNRLTGDRPEIYIPLPAEAEPAQTESAFSVGQKVRVHTGAYAGRVGSIEQILPGLTQLPSGLRSNAAKVRFDQRSSDLFPLVNLDIVQLIN
ncbi:MAG: hypothetical protein AAGU17_08145 [Anaerolineaceae bacterium]|jgi:hypothetical protein